jgi:hypothetical protein
MSPRRNKPATFARKKITWLEIVQTRRKEVSNATTVKKRDICRGIVPNQEEEVLGCVDNGNKVIAVMEKIVGIGMEKMMIGNSKTEEGEGLTEKGEFATIIRKEIVNMVKTAGFNMVMTVAVIEKTESIVEEMNATFVVMSVIMLVNVQTVTTDNTTEEIREEMLNAIVVEVMVICLMSAEKVVEEVVEAEESVINIKKAIVAMETGADFLIKIAAEVVVRVALGAEVIPADIDIVMIDDYYQGVEVVENSFGLTHYH